MSAAVLIALAGCVPHPAFAPTSPAVAASCPVIGQGGEWHAWLDAMPGPGAQGARLVISGEVDMPAPGYTLALEPGMADRAMPPSQRFRLVATGPSDITTQVVTRTPVRYSAKATYPTYRSIVVLCGDRVLATISHIETVS